MIEKDNTINLSENAIKIISDWVVSQGYKYWHAIFSEKTSLSQAIEKHDTELECHQFSWNLTISNPIYQLVYDPRFLANGICESKFGKSLVEIDEEILENIYKTRTDD